MFLSLIPHPHRSLISMEAKKKRPEPATPPSGLRSDDLLRLIPLRLSSPKCLVRAAAVSRHWLRHASDRALLRCFRARHPPCLLGFYLHTSSTGHWKLVNTIRLRHASSPRHLADRTWESDGDVVYVAAVGDNANFVFLLIDREILYMHISSRKAEKICDIPLSHGLLLELYPLMTAWPSNFPVLNDGHNQHK